MDMFDFSQIFDLLKIESGHGLTQSLLLFMIWMSSRGVKKELIELKNSLFEHKIQIDTRFEKIEVRLNKLEFKGEK